MMRSLKKHCLDCLKLYDLQLPSALTERGARLSSVRKDRCSCYYCYDRSEYFERLHVIIYVPTDMFETYKADAQWSKLAIEAIQ